MASEAFSFLWARWLFSAHEVAVLAKDKESVELVRIQKGMEVCPWSTKALLMAMTVRSCVPSGEKIFDDEDMDCGENGCARVLGRTKNVSIWLPTRELRKWMRQHVRGGCMWCPARHA